MPSQIICALAAVKQAAARVNRRHGLDATLAYAIEEAAQAIRAGDYDDQFPLTIFQTGSGTQTNMNVNEVIAGIANEKLAGTRGGRIEANEGRIAELVERSLMLVTALGPEVGYDNAATIAKHALNNGQTLKEAGLALGLVDAETFERLVRPGAMVS